MGRGREPVFFFSFFFCSFGISVVKLAGAAEGCLVGVVALAAVVELEVDCCSGGGQQQEPGCPCRRRLLLLLRRRRCFRSLRLPGGRASLSTRSRPGSHRRCSVRSGARRGACLFGLEREEAGGPCESKSKEKRLKRRKNDSGRRISKPPSINLVALRVCSSSNLFLLKPSFLALRAKNGVQSPDTQKRKKTETISYLLVT